MITPTAYQVCSPRLEHRNRPRWLTHRRDGVGGSDAAPVVLGQAGRYTRWQVWHDKTLAPPPAAEEEQPEWIEFGHVMEPVMARLWARRVKIPGRMHKPGMLAHLDRPWLRVNLDRIVDDCGLGRGPCIVECKNRSAYQSKEWGEDADSVPDAPALQVHHGLMVTGFDHGHLLATIGGNQLRPYLIEADPELHKMMLDAESAFWFENCIAGEPPAIDGTERTGEILARLWQVDPGKVAVASPEASESLAVIRALKAEIAALEEEKDRRAHEIQQAMGDAEVLTDAAGRELATWKQNSTFRANDFAAAVPVLAAGYELPAVRYDTKLLGVEHPDLYRQYRARAFKVKTPREERADG
jgi:putative phage-type endonuclease